MLEIKVCFSEEFVEQYDVESAEAVKNNIATTLHESLKGNEDYVNNDIIIDTHSKNNELYVCFSKVFKDECKHVEIDFLEDILKSDLFIKVLMQLKD